MYTALAEIPVPVGGQFIGDTNSIELIFSVRDHDLNLKRTLVKTVGGISEDQPTTSPAVHLDPSQVASLYSPSGRKRVVLRDGKDNTGNTKRSVELWKETVKESSVDVTDVHDKFYADEYIGSLSFNTSEDAVIYTAESRPQNNAGSGSGDPFAKFRYRPDFGEGLSGKRSPTTFIVRWPRTVPGEGKTQPVLYRLNTPDHLRLGQFVFSTRQKSDSVTLFATGYELQSDGRLLGVKGCFNRPSGIWKVEATLVGDTNDQGTPKEVETRVTKLTASDMSCRSPRVVLLNGEEQVLLLSCASGGPHVTTSSLYSWKDDSGAVSGNGELTALVGPGPGWQGVPLKGCPGLYPAYNLAASPYLAQVDGGSTVLHSHVGSKTLIAFFSLDGVCRKVWDPSGSDLYSWSILDTDGKSKVLCWRSSPSVPYEIGILDAGNLNDIVWKPLDKPYLDESVSKSLETIRASIYDVPECAPTEAIVISSTLSNAKEGKVPPCILAPHGGPHATTTTAFNAANIALVLEGYTLALPNYTGSLGYGEEALRALVGQCGRRDVDDCVGSLDHLIKLGLAEEGEGRLFVMGGSHGGFLAAHLIGQFPNKFSGAVMRNPVISVGEISTTDIPDWYFSEFGFSYPVRSTLAPTALDSGDSSSKKGIETADLTIPPLITGDTFTQLQGASPVRYIDLVKTPVLLLVGLADRRVAPTHSIEYYHALTARGQMVELLTFEGESHPLDGVEAARVCWEAGRNWFNAVVKR